MSWDRVRSLKPQSPDRVFGLNGLLVLIAFVLVSSCGSSTWANEKTPKEEHYKEELDFLKHKRLVYDCFKRYMDYSDFLDTNSFVTAHSIEKFKDLFLDNAKVWNDYLWEPKFEYASVYADQVFYYHRIRGLKVIYEHDVLDRLYSLNEDQLLKNIDKSDPDNYIYKYEFRAKKGIYYILNKEQKVIYFDEPIEYDLKFIFHITSEDERAHIIDVLPYEKASKK